MKREIAHPLQVHRHRYVPGGSIDLDVVPLHGDLARVVLGVAVAELVGMLYIVGVVWLDGPRVLDQSGRDPQMEQYGLQIPREIHTVTGHKLGALYTVGVPIHHRNLVHVQLTTGQTVESTLSDPPQHGRVAHHIILGEGGIVGPHEGEGGMVGPGQTGRHDDGDPILAV